MGLPAVVGAAGATAQVVEGQELGLDGDAGICQPAPSPSLRAVLLQAQRRVQAIRKRDREEFGAGGLNSTATADGVRLRLMANVRGPADVKAAVEGGAEGIGLYRTELLYADALDAPDEQEQFELYSAALREMGSSPVVLRTLDAGGDKPMPCLDLPKEANPFLGLRGLRFSLAHPGVLVTQLRAALRAGAGGDLRIMFPMVTLVEEARAAQSHVREVAEELRAEGLPFGRCPVGMMVETPAAALASIHLAREVDFLSIGTNDLMQYTFAADRSNAAVSHLSDPFHPVVLGLVRRVATAAESAGIQWEVCGESAAEPLLAALYVAWGASALSVSPGSIPSARRAISSVQVKTWAQDDVILDSCATAGEVKAVLAGAFEPIRPPAAP
jgi:phosphotransferase system enzyme I (PtsI)